MSSGRTPLPPLLMDTRYEPRVWGGFRLGSGNEPIGEGWGAFEDNAIASGPVAGATLAEACERFGPDLLGEPVVERFGKRFPILTKLLDTSEWLSVQVHPNDEQAVELEGAGHVGKTEAWHLLETTPDAEIILGLKPGVDAARFAGAIRSGHTLDVIARQVATAGDTWFVPAGTVHALGPGIFLYEVQQSSDITYRIYDWDRPSSTGRGLHLDQAIRCVDPRQGDRIPKSSAEPGEAVTLIDCPYFRLDRAALAPGMVASVDTGQSSFHALTAIGGEAVIRSAAGEVLLENYETAIVPATSGRYEAVSRTPVTLMISLIPINEQKAR